MSQFTITTSCPNCSKKFELDTELLGSKGRCDSCHCKFVIAEDKTTTTQEVDTSQQQADVTLASPQVKRPKSNAGTVVIAALLLAAVGGGIYYWSQPDIQRTEGRATEEVVDKEDDDELEEKIVKGGVSSNNDKLVALGETFPVKQDFERINIEKYKGTYRHVYGGWMPKKANQGKAAKEWQHYLGPLGVRVRTYVPEWQSLATFAPIVPNCLRSESGRLALTAAEVTSIAPGAPAEGHLQVGDFIIGIEGEPLVSGERYRPDWQLMHKAKRELQLMLGDKLDQAQGRGDVRLTVMRYPEESAKVFSKKLEQKDGRQSTGRVAVSEGDEIHLIVEPNRKKRRGKFAWISPEISGPSGVINLADPTMYDSVISGWGKIEYKKGITGRKLGEKGIVVDARSKIVYKVPAGANSFNTAMLTTDAKTDVKVEVVVVKRRQALPVARKELWRGKGGNRTVGVQPFDVALEANGFLTIETNQFDDSTRYDKSNWLDLEFVGSYGIKSLLDLRIEPRSLGYSAPKVISDTPLTIEGKEYKRRLGLHANGEAKWQIPPGTTRVRGKFAASSSGKVQPRIFFTNPSRPLSGIHKKKIVELRFPIGKAGQYSDTFPKNCPKSELTAKRHVAWLAAQQRENGSWPRLAGYTGDGWDTAWCGLALMSSGDSQYDRQIKQAAYYVAYETSPPGWTAERTMRLIFLSEYYLRTKDTMILAGIQNAYHQVVATCKTDFVAGHKVTGFGYGIKGQHYGTGHLALALALASRTPITVNEKLVANVIRHAGEVCVNGTYAYGRGRRLARNQTRQHAKGHAMIGPAMLGVMIGGGHESAVKEYMERCYASIGDGDNSHATSSLAFIFSSLAMASEDEKLFLQHMQAFKYKMAIDDCWEGGFLKSAFPLDLQLGEKITSYWIRSAGSILVLNALKHNLAITGKKELHNPKSIETIPVSEWGGQVHSYYLRNWCLAKELLSDKSPKMLTTGIKQMSELPRDMSLVPETRAIVQKIAPLLAEKIAADRSLGELQRGYAIELISGLDFQILTKLDGGKQQVELDVFLPLHELNWRDSDKEKMYTESPLKLKAMVKIIGENFDQPMNFEIDSSKGFEVDKGTREFKMSRSLKDESKNEFGGFAEISFTIGDNKLSYRRPLKFNEKGLPRRRGANTVNMRRFELKLKVAPRAYYQSQPLMIAGHAFDFMFPEERMIDVDTPEKGNIVIHEGDEVVVELASENFICGWMFGYKYKKMSQVDVRMPKSYRSITGGLTGKLQALHDFDDSTACPITLDNGKAVIEYDFGKAVSANGLDVQTDRLFAMVRVWYQEGEHWVPLVWDNFVTKDGYNARFADTSARRWRVEITRSRCEEIQTLRFYHNKNRISKQTSDIQARDKKYLPPIQPK